jgi:hypothetical protein
MKIYVGQIYIQAGINYPFSYIFQKWIHEELSKLVEPSGSFLKKFSIDFTILFSLSAKSEIEIAEIKGPTIYKKDKDIEFTVFLPHDGKAVDSYEDCRKPLEIFFSCLATALESLTLDASLIKKNSHLLIEKILSNQLMFDNLADK